MMFNARMHDRTDASALPWLGPEDPFPAPAQAWGPGTQAPGLLAISSTLEATQIERAYRRGIFPWYSAGQPVLWWSPDPRMTLDPGDFRLHRSLRQSLRRWLLQDGVTLAFDRDFRQVMQRCAAQPRQGQNGTWIVPDMVEAYTLLHQRGLAHSAELWRGSELMAGLYFVAIGHAVFGESMFTTVRDGSKMALCLLVSVARKHGVPFIDCQQNTRHLASLGATEKPRGHFLEQVHAAVDEPPIDWARETLYWQALKISMP